MNKVIQSSLICLFCLYVVSFSHADPEPDSTGNCKVKRAKVAWCKLTANNCASGASPNHTTKGEIAAPGECDCSCSWVRTEVNNPSNCKSIKNYPPMCDHNPGIPNCVTSDCRKCKDNKYYHYQYPAGSGYWILNRYSKQCP